MNKPKSQKVAKEGSKVYKVLKVLIDLPEDRKFKSLKALSSFFFDYGVGVTTNALSKFISFYNQGLFIVDGVTANEHSLDVFTTKRKKKKKKDEGQLNWDNTSVFHDDCDRGGDLSEEKLKTFADACIEAGIDPSQASGGWLKNKGISVRMTGDNNSEDELKSWNDNLDIAKEKMRVDFERDGLSWSNNQTTTGDGVGVLNIADLHLGALVKGLRKTPDYSSDVLRKHLLRVAEQTNRRGYDKVYVNILGDLIECFGSGGLMHPEMWKEMEYGIYGANAIKLCVEIIHECLLDRIENLVEVNVCGGNHDRASGHKDLDTDSTTCNLICWGLEMLGYDITFDSLIISKEIDGINYLLHHGDKILSKRPPKELAWEYGKQGMFNFSLSGHLHSRHAKKIETISDDANAVRHMIIPSIFSGNGYSERGLWHSLAGFIIIENNGEGRPNVFDYAL